MSDSLLEILSALQAIEGAREKQELSLSAVWYFRAEGCLERVVLECGVFFISILADQDDDTVKIWSSQQADFPTKQAVNVIAEQPWKYFAGRSLAWGWATVNQQGYCDGLLLSFDGIKPQLCLNVLASSIKMFSVTEISPQI